MEYAELSSRLENIIRFGTVAAINHATQRVRIDTGGNLTGWLQWRTARAGTTRTWEPPTVGEQVVILSPSGVLENGIVLPGLYSDTYDAPSASPDEHVTHYPDGAVVSYNHSTGALVASGIQTATIQAAISITLDTPLTHCTGKLTVEDLLTYHNGLAGTGGSNANTITGHLTHTTGNLSSNGKVLHTHTHSGVQSGGANTGQPT